MQNIAYNLFLITYGIFLCIVILKIYNLIHTLVKKIINHYAKSVFLNIFKITPTCTVFVKSPGITEEVTLLLSKAGVQM